MILETLYHSTLFYTTIQQENLHTFKIVLIGAVSIFLMWLIIVDIIKLILFPTTLTYNLRKKYSICDLLFSQELYQHEIWWVRRVFKIILFTSMIFATKLAILVLILISSWLLTYFLCITLSIFQALFYVNSTFKFLIALIGIAFFIWIISLYGGWLLQIITNPPPKIMNLKLR